MARDLHAVGAEHTPFEERLDFGPPGPIERSSVNSDDIDRQLRTVQREQKLAGIAVMLIDAAKLLEPVVDLLSDKALRWAALACTVGLTSYAIAHPSWERAAITGGFAILVPWVIRKSRP